jgi:two-component system sensor histidine kinase/response regulator
VGQKGVTSYAPSSDVIEKELLSIRETPDGERRVLVVDDEECLVDALSEFLSIKGYEVEAATNPRQALALVHEKTFGVVVSDLRLPGMNGVELLEHVLDVDPQTVVVIMTGYASVQSAVEALKKGAYDYVVKPFSVHDLEKIVNLGLERRRLSRENLGLSHLMRKMVEIDQIKSDIISSVSHEFRTPLTSLKGYLTMLTQAWASGTRVEQVERTWLHAMRDNLGRLEMLILNLLLMSEANTGGLIIADEEIEVSDMVRQAVSRLDTLARSREVTVSVNCPLGKPIRGDREKLGVAIGNLVENAVKFSLASSVVDIGSTDTSDPEGVEISVSDKGVGIPEEKLPKMFDRFTQLDMTGTRRFNGAGLGLPVAKMIVEAHGGRIRAESKPGVGSTFRVWLPQHGGQ